MTSYCNTVQVDDINDLLAQVRYCLAKGAFAKARHLAEALLASNPTVLAARLIANQAAFIQGDYPGAMAHAEAGLIHYPANADLHLRRARCLIVWNDPAAARSSLASARQAADTTPTFALPPPWAMIGDAYTLIGDFADAIASYGQAITNEPQMAHHYFNRAVVHRYLGEREQATQDYEKAIALDSAYAEAWLNLVHLNRQTQTVNGIAAMERVQRHLPSTPQTLRQRINLHYALAKSYEDLGEGAPSFAHLEAGAKLLRRSYQYDVRRDVEVIEAIKSAYSVQGKPSSPGLHGLKPIFVVGLPRSGSTLVERILTSHAQVGSIGESTALVRALTTVAQAAGIAPNDDLAIAKAGRSLDPGAIARSYTELTAPWRGSDAFFVDKLPSNHLHVGAIFDALPDARVIHVVRKPLTNLYGMYKTLFNRAYPYSYDLDELVTYFAAYRGLMEHWRSAYGDRLIEICYEELIANPAYIMRKLLADCGLEWQPACLKFQDNPQPCTTQSATQIRAPLNREGVEGWRRFQSELEPLRAKLAIILQ